MTTKRDDAPDLTAIATDDALLDALGRGDPATDDDGLAGLLAAWRSDLDDGPTADFDVTALLSELGDEPDDAGELEGAVESVDAVERDTDSIRPAVPTEDAVPDGDAVPVQPVPLARPRRWRPSRRMRGYLTGVAAALVLIAGLAVGAGQAGPDSPLWPIARVLYPDRVDLRLAEYNIDRARVAAADGRYDDARRTLDKAAGNVDHVGDPKLAGKLRAQIEEIRRTLPPTGTAERDSTSTSPTPSTSSSSPGATVPTTPPAGQGQPGGQTDAPGGGSTPEQPGGGGIIPGLPAIPTPTLPIPLPTIPLPTLPILG